VHAKNRIKGIAAELGLRYQPISHRKPTPRFLLTLQEIDMLHENDNIFKSMKDITFEDTVVASMWSHDERPGVEARAYWPDVMSATIISG